MYLLFELESVEHFLRVNNKHKYKYVLIILVVKKIFHAKTTQLNTINISVVDSSRSITNTCYILCKKIQNFINCTNETTVQSEIH